jgi:hypothetical protein
VHDRDIIPRIVNRCASVSAANRVIAVMQVNVFRFHVALPMALLRPIAQSSGQTYDAALFSYIAATNPVSWLRDRAATDSSGNQRSASIA